MKKKKKKDRKWWKWKKWEKVKKSEKEGDLKCRKQNLKNCPRTVVTLSLWYTKSPTPHSPPKFAFFPQIAPYYPRFSKRINNQLLKNTLIICRVWRNAISSEIYYISSKWMRHWATKLNFLAKYSNFWVKCLIFRVKCLRNWCEYSRIWRKNTKIYQKKNLKNTIIIGFKIRKSGR